MRARRRSTGAMADVQKGVCRPLSRRRSGEAIWRSYWALSSHAAEGFCLAPPAAARGRDDGVLSAADGAADGDGRQRPEGSRRLCSRCSRSRRTARRLINTVRLSAVTTMVTLLIVRRSPDCSCSGIASPAAPCSDRDADLSAGVSGRRGRLHDHSSRRARALIGDSNRLFGEKSSSPIRSTACFSAICISPSRASFSPSWPRCRSSMSAWKKPRVRSARALGGAARCRAAGPGAGLRRLRRDCLCHRRWARSVRRLRWRRTSMCCRC